MSKNKVELMPSDSNMKTPTTVSYGMITEVRESCVIVKTAGAVRLIPLYRFIKEDDKANLIVGAKVKLNHYFSNSPKNKLLAYNAELTSE